jgi:hypothetical protein
MDASKIAIFVPEGTDFYCKIEVRGRTFYPSSCTSLTLKEVTDRIDDLQQAIPDEGGEKEVTDLLIRELTDLSFLLERGPSNTTGLVVHFYTFDYDPLLHPIDLDLRYGANRIEEEPDQEYVERIVCVHTPLQIEVSLTEFERKIIEDGVYSIRTHDPSLISNKIEYVYYDGSTITDSLLEYEGKLTVLASLFNRDPFKVERRLKVDTIVYSHLTELVVDASWLVDYSSVREIVVRSVHVSAYGKILQIMKLATNLEALTIRPDALLYFKGHTFPTITSLKLTTTEGFRNFISSGSPSIKSIFPNAYHVKCSCEGFFNPPKWVKEATLIMNRTLPSVPAYPRINSYHLEDLTCLDNGDYDFTIKAPKTTLVPHSRLGTPVSCSLVLAQSNVRRPTIPGLQPVVSFAKCDQKSARSDKLMA